MPIQLFGKTLDEYLETGRLPKNVRPHCCEHCGSQGRFHRHDSYPRNNVFLNGVWLLVILYIQRFTCCQCGGCFSLIPLFLFKNQQASLRDQQMALENENNAAANEFHPRTIARWKQRWKRAAAEHQQTLTRTVLAIKADISVDASPLESTDALSYLGFLVRQLPKQVPILLELLALMRYGGHRVAVPPQNLSDSHRAVVWV